MQRRAAKLENLPKLAFSPTEAAYVLALGRTKTYELIAQGRLRSIRVGRRLLIPAEAIREFLTQEITGKKDGGTRSFA
ncbi:MAG: excisionase family DNA-binding protein [Bacillota bacterium]